MEGAIYLADAVREAIAKGADLEGAAKKFEQRWKPETDAMTEITERADVLAAGPLQIAKLFVLDKLGSNAFSNSKRSNMSYSEALAREVWATRGLYAVLGIGMLGVVAAAAAAAVWRGEDGREEIRA